MTVILITNKRDITSDFIVRELKKRGRKFVRLNTEELSRSQFVFKPLVGQFLLKIGETTIRSEDIKAAYFRRPGIPEVDGNVTDSAKRHYALVEWNSLLKSLYLFIGDRWFSHPQEIAIAEDKPLQLTLARQLGFEIPDTVITNNFEEARAFVRSGPTVGKPLKQALLDDENTGRVIFTTEIVSLDDAARESIAVSPIIFQRLIAKRTDVRVTVVVDRVFAVAIHSQAREESCIDWRAGSNPDLRHEIVSLPQDIEARCVGLVKALNLKFGAIDLVLDPDGNYWFLECNPNGQWAWIENRTGLPIASAIVDELAR